MHPKLEHSLFKFCLLLKNNTVCENVLNIEQGVNYCIAEVESII